MPNAEMQTDADKMHAELTHTHTHSSLSLERLLLWGGSVPYCLI